MRSFRRIPARRISRRLRLLALVAALGGLSFSLTQITPERLVTQAQSLSAGAGSTLTALVPANPYNTLADQLYKKEQALNEREAALDQRDTTWHLSLGEMLGIVSFVLSLLLCVLIGINFYLDMRRGKRPFANRLSVDLR
jgi:predicted PurR-regulated permease PerM